MLQKHEIRCGDMRNVLSGAMEVGESIYFVGDFGGFGGSIAGFFYSEEAANEFIIKNQFRSGGCSVYKLNPEHLYFLTNEGEIIKED